MGFLEQMGVDSGILGSISSITTNLMIIGIIGIVIVVVGAIVSYIYYSKKTNTEQFKYSIPIFIKIHGKYQRVDVDKAKEVFVPDTNIGLFYLQKRKIYIARPTRSMGKNEFWYAISENGEWINFDLSTKEEDDMLAQANYDHRDTRYAYVNLKEIIKKNYKDQNTKWWKEYSHIITFIIVSFVFVASCWLLLMRIGDLITQLGPIAEKMTIVAESMEKAVQISQNLNSGIAAN